VHADGSVWCWGDNAYGQLGDGTNVPHRMPARVTGLSGATQVSAGEFHSCARLGDGRVACWGKNSDGEIGDLTATHRWAPVFVNLGSDTALTVTSGFSYNCVMTAALGATCWGYNGFGQIGDGTFNNAWSPVKITLQ
jgi:alpha-tubulin suppressor-like RCC1 family protein